MASQILSAFYAQASRGHLQDPITYMETPGTLPVGTASEPRFAQVRALERERDANNKRTWEVVSSEATRVLGSERFNRICNRYELNIDYMKTSAAPFLAKHAEMIGIGSADLRTTDLKAYPQEKLKYCPTYEIWRRMQVANPEPYIGNEESVAYIQEGRNNSGFNVFHDLALQDKERLHLARTMHQIYDFRAFHERLAKAIASKEMDEKTIIAAPTYNGYIDYYKVYKKIADGNGLVAYALKPISIYSTLDPIVVFRSTPLNPTALDALETWRNDFHYNIGQLGYQSSQTALNDLMNDPKFTSKKIVVTGFSLGGTHTQFLIKDHWPKVKEAFFFNDPSIDSVTSEVFADELNSQFFIPGQNPDLTLRIYRTKGDIVHLAGTKHLGIGITTPKVKVELTEVKPHEDVQLSYVGLHTRRFFDNPHVLYQERVVEGEELQQELHNTLRGNFAIWFERIRRLIGGYVVAPMLIFFFWIIEKIASIFGYQVLRNSQAEEV